MSDDVQKITPIRKKTPPEFENIKEITKGISHKPNMLLTKLVVVSYYLAFLNQMTK